MLSIMKTRQNNNVTDHKDVISTKYDIEFQDWSYSVWSMVKMR